MIQTTAIVAILICAPMGAILLNTFGDKLLEKDEEGPSADPHSHHPADKDKLIHKGSDDMEGVELGLRKINQPGGGSPAYANLAGAGDSSPADSLLTPKLIRKTS